MSNVVEQLTPNPVTHEHGENGCCPDTRAWEMEMMHQVWSAGLHDAANCFQDALKAKCNRHCETCWLDWLRSPVEDGDE